MSEKKPADPAATLVGATAIGVILAALVVTVATRSWELTVYGLAAAGFLFLGWGVFDAFRKKSKVECPYCGWHPGDKVAS